MTISRYFAEDFGLIAKVFRCSGYRSCRIGVGDKQEPVGQWLNH